LPPARPFASPPAPPVSANAPVGPAALVPDESDPGPDPGALPPSAHSGEQSGVGPPGAVGPVQTPPTHIGPGLMTTGRVGGAVGKQMLRMHDVGAGVGVGSGGRVSVGVGTGKLIVGVGSGKLMVGVGTGRLSDGVGMSCGTAEPLA
jgi:hypothetical protein